MTRYEEECMARDTNLGLSQHVTNLTRFQATHRVSLDSKLNYFKMNSMVYKNFLHEH